MKKSLLILCWALGLVIQGIAGPIDDLAPGHWYEVPDSRMADVAPAVIPGGKSDNANVITAWNGGAYDSKRDRLIVWGGGHGDYAGNEIYLFDINTLQWIRWTDPTLEVPGSGTADPLSDGRPGSRHTYNGLQYIPPPVDRFWASGGSLWKAGDCGGKTWMFDFNATPHENGWSQQSSMGNDCGAASGYDSVTGKIFFLTKVGYGTQLLSFNTKNLGSPWQVVKSSTLRNLYQTGAVDPIRRKFVLIGGTGYGGTARTESYNTDASNPARIVLPTTGAKEIEGVNAAGFEYDPVIDKFVAWGGGKNGTRPQDVHVLDMDKLTWTRVVPASGNTVVPTAATKNGTYGRFRYMPSKNAYIVVNSVYENVFIYKLHGGLSAKEAPRPWLSGGFRLDVFPNPYTGSAPLTVSMPHGAGAAVIALYNCAGVRVWQGRAARSNPGRIWLRGLNPGVYYLKADFDNHTLSKRLVVLR